MTRSLSRFIACVVLASTFLFSTAQVQTPLQVKPLAERTVTELPPGELSWRLENFSALADAQAAAGRWGLAVESAGKA